MKTLFKILFIVAINIMVATSCTKESRIPVNDTKLVPITLSAQSAESVDSVEVKTTLNGGKTVLWEKQDKVSLLSGVGYQTVTEMIITDMDETGTWAKFEGKCEEGSESFIAVYPYSNNYTYDDGSIAVTIPSEQTAVLSGFQSGANVAVAYSEDDKLLFNNVGSVIGITLWASEASKTKKLTLKARKSETEYCKLSGTSTIAFDKGVLQVSEGDKDYITLLPPAGSETFAGGTYYFVVYPGEYKGFEVTFTDIYDRNIMRANSKSQTLGRSEKVLLERIPNPYSILPAGDLNVTVDFTQKWPFEEPIAAPEAQAKAGETYTYHHPVTFKEEATFEPLSFVISKNGGQNGYIHFTDQSPYYLNTQATGTSYSKFITLPGIAGKYLKSIEVYYRSGTDKSFKISGVQSSMGYGYNSDPKLNYLPAKFIFSSNTVQSEKGKAYTMSEIAGNSSVKSIELVYTDEAPE